LVAASSAEATLTTAKTNNKTTDTQANIFVIVNSLCEMFMEQHFQREEISLLKETRSMKKPSQTGYFHQFHQTFYHHNDQSQYFGKKRQIFSIIEFRAVVVKIRFSL
jgi:predicted Zn-dependent peptidase